MDGGEVRRFEIEPGDFGISVCSLGDVLGGDAERNAVIMREVLGGDKGAAADAVAMNAGAGLYVAGRAESIADGVAEARRILAAGDALPVLDDFVAATQECGA